MTLTTRELLTQYATTMEELRKRGVVRSSNNPAADYAEGLVARALGLKLTEGSNKGFDALDANNRRYQIKCRRLTSHNPSRQLSAMRGMKEQPFDLLAAILFSQEFSVMRAALVPFAVVLERSSYVERTNSWRFLLRDEIWTIPEVEDITIKVQEAQQ
jgi:hypothetical protein